MSRQSKGKEFSVFSSCVVVFFIGDVVNHDHANVGVIVLADVKLVSLTYEETKISWESEIMTFSRTPVSNK